MSVRSKIKALRIKYDITDTNQELFKWLMEMSPRGIKTFELAIWLGRHYGDWEYFSKLAKKYTEEEGIKVKKIRKGTALLFIREDDHRTYSQYYAQMKLLVKEETKTGGGIPLPQALVEARELRSEKARERRIVKELEKKNKIKLRQEALISRVNALPLKSHKCFIINELAACMNITSTGARIHLRKWIDAGIVEQLSQGKSGRGHASTYGTTY